ncbi:MAG: Panacea domain-containing protein [Hyphomicrobiales bacterium]|nr:Panacea domain-containing protein [Hyphomicrobiales bacterium]
MAFVAARSPGLTPLFVSKIFFFAEKWHLNRYGRPIIADNYIAMPKGPVPSTIKNYIDRKWSRVGKPDGFNKAVNIERRGLNKLYPGERSPDLSVLSQTDLECLQEAIDFCREKSADELSELTHLERAWFEADENGSMNYLFFLMRTMKIEMN